MDIKKSMTGTVKIVLVFIVLILFLGLVFALTPLSKLT